MYTVNERIRKVIELSGLSQEKFAKRIKRSRGEVANIIYDKVVPKKEIIEAICDEFGIRENWMRHGLEPMWAPVTREEEIAEMVGKALNGSNDFKKTVIRMICSRTEQELEVLDKALRDLYDEMKKD